MMRRPPITRRTDTLLPYTTLCRSATARSASPRPRSNERPRVGKSSAPPGFGRAAHCVHACGAGTMTAEIGFDDFHKVDIRVGTIVEVQPFPEIGRAHV